MYTISEIFIPIAAIIVLLIYFFLNKHNKIMRLYLKQGIEYCYIQANNKEAFSPKFSKLFSDSAAFSSLKDLNKIIGQQQSNKLQEKILEKKGRIVLDFLAHKDQRKFIEATIESISRSDIIIGFRDVSYLLKSVNAKLNKCKEDSQFYLDVLNNIPIPIWSRDSDNKIVYCNNIYKQMVSHASADSIPEINKVSASIAKMARKLQRYSEDKYIIVANERKLFSISESVFREDLLLGFALDQSEKEETTKELQQYLEAQNSFLEASSSAIAIYTSDSKIKYFNQAFINLWGLDEKWLFTYPTYGEILEELRRNRKLPEQANFSAFKKERMKLFTQLSETYNEYMYLPDGRSLRIIVIPFALRGLLFAFEDITSSLALERSFNSLSAVQRAMLNNLSEAIAVFGQDGRLKLYNPAYLKLWEMDEQYAGNSPHISDILESKKYLFNISDDNNWHNIKNDLIAVLYEREFQRAILKLNNDMLIYRAVAPLPDGATLITYINNSDLVKCQASLSEKNMILNDFFLFQHQFIINIAKQVQFLISALEREINGLVIKEGSNNLNEIFKEVKHQQEEMVNLSRINLFSVNSSSVVIDVERLLDQAIKEAGNHIDVKEVALLFSDYYNGSIVGNYNRISVILSKIMSYIVELDSTKPSVNIEAGNVKQKLLIKFKVMNCKIEYDIIEQKFLLLQALLEVYGEKLSFLIEEDILTIVFELSQVQVNTILVEGV